MPNPRGKSKVKISGSKPEPPTFIQKIREQLVADEDADRKEQSEKKRKSRPHKTEDTQDRPELVRVEGDDVTEEEFEQLKKDLKTHYRLDKKTKLMEDVDMDHLIKSRENMRILKGPVERGSRDKPAASVANEDAATESRTGGGSTEKPVASRKKPTKTLNYGSSSSGED